MANWQEETKPQVYKSQINIPYEWWAGETASRFYIEIRDNKKIMGTKCPECRKVFVPPRKNCPQCYDPETEWVDVKDEGVLVSYTVSRRKTRLRPEAPLAFGLIKLDGAHTSLTHWIKEIDPGDIKTGMKLKAVYKDEREGNILDIAYFKPA